MNIVVGDVELPDLPPGCPVVLDTEGSGLHPDGDPGTDTNMQKSSPPARVSAASVAWQDPDTGAVHSHAWPFDQGPIVGKPGRVRRPSDGGGHPLLTQEDVDRILSKFHVPGLVDLAPSEDTIGEISTRPMTQAEACPNLGLEHWIRLLRWLRQRDHVVMHNAKHDVTVLAVGPREEVARNQWLHNPGLRAEFPHRARQMIDPILWGDDPLGPWLGLDLDRDCPDTRLDDTMLIQALLEPLHPVALKRTSRRLWGEDSTQEEYDLQTALKKLGVGLTKRYDLIPWPILGPYAAKDAELTLRLYLWQLALIETGECPPHTLEQIDKDIDLMRVLYRMQRRGVGYDARTSLQVAADLQDTMDDIAQDLPFDPAKLTQVGRYYFGPQEEGGRGLTPLKVTEKRHDPCVDESQIRILVQQGEPFATEYDEWSHCKSAMGKWYRGWAMRTGPDGRLRTDFMQTAVESDRPGAPSGGAISGRLAVGRVQLQAIPHLSQLPKVARDRPVRGLIRARPGCALYEMDLPQGEVRIATVITNCTAMWDVIDSGEDLHGSNAKRIWGVTEVDPQYKDLRGVGKRVTFGTMYGAGIETLRAQILEHTGLEYSAAQTKDARSAFFREFPEFRSVPYLIQRQADRGLGGCGYVTLIDGRRRWFHHTEHTHKAFNAVIQGDLAQSGKTWMIEVERQLPGIQVLAVHDSLVVEVPEGDAGYAMAQQAAQIGTEIYERDYGVRGRPMRFPIVPELWGADK